MIDQTPNIPVTSQKSQISQTCNMYPVAKYSEIPGGPNKEGNPLGSISCLLFVLDHPRFPQKTLYKVQSTEYQYRVQSTLYLANNSAQSPPHTSNANRRTLIRLGRSLLLCSDFPGPKLRFEILSSVSNMNVEWVYATRDHCFVA